MVPTNYYVVLSAVLFGLGIVAFVFKRNIITIFMAIELMLNAVNLAFVAFSRALGKPDGEVFVLFVIVEVWRPYWASSSAFQAEASDRASRTVLEAMLAQAARPQAIVPLPAIAGRSYVSAPVTGVGVYHGGPLRQPPPGDWLTVQSLRVCS